MQAEDIKPYGMFVLVERQEMDDMTPGGIALPGTMGERSQWVRVLKVGNGMIAENGAHIQATLALPGALCSLRQYEGQPISVLQKNLLIVDGRFLEGVKLPAEITAV